MALRTAWSIITSAPTGDGAPAVEARRNRYAYLDAWEQGTVFGGVQGPSQWSESLKQALRLYRYTRLVWNPVPDLTDFWGAVYAPGVLTRDGQPQPDGTPSALAFAPDTDAALVAAAAQVWWWSGMQHQKYVIPQWAAIAGNVLLEVVDDLAGRKILIRPVWAGKVADLTLNPAGDVLAYALEYRDTDAVGRDYTYRQEVTRAAYRTFRDGKPWDYSGDLHLGAVWANPWGFVPACWVPHQPTGGPWGAPAIGAALAELLTINSKLSMLDDGIDRGLKPMPWIATDGDVTAVFAGGAAGATSAVDPSEAGRQSVAFIKLPGAAAVGKFDITVDVPGTAAELEQRIARFKHHFPELDMWESLRARDVSGVAAEILHGDTRNKAVAIRAVTDRQLEKATQMAITMGGTRFNTGSWQGTDARHAVFAPYDLGSFGRGDLDFALAARPLVPAAPLTETERAELADLRLNNLRLPATYVYTELGVPEDVIAQAAADVAAKAAAAAATAAAAPAVQPFPDPLQNQMRAAMGTTAKADGAVG